jgi:hypothetical protein
MRRWFVRLLTVCGHILWWLAQWLHCQAHERRGDASRCWSGPSERLAQLKPQQEPHGGRSRNHSPPRSFFLLLRSAKSRTPVSSFIYLVCLVCWLKETNQMSQINQINKTN